MSNLLFIVLVVAATINGVLWGLFIEFPYSVLGAALVGLLMGMIDYE